MTDVRVEGIAAVIVDLEGTTSSTLFVYEQLFPYSRERFAEWVGRADVDPAIARVVREVGVLIGQSDPSDDAVVAALEGWLDRDEKVTPLKTLQGYIWAEGFADGELTSHFFPDVLPALRRWHERGLREYVYSSGSVTAQQSWFRHTPEGDLLDFFSGNFDTETAGPKRESTSYLAITDAIGLPAHSLLFLSDSGAELDAARAAGWQTIGLGRPGEPNTAIGTPGHPEVTSFEAIMINGQH
ncbi:MAG: acireductone synthase [Ilumatobacteraceae bacterium]